MSSILQDYRRVHTQAATFWIHLVTVPFNVIAIFMLLSLVGLDLPEFHLTLAHIVMIVAGVWIAGKDRVQGILLLSVLIFLWSVAFRVQLLLGNEKSAIVSFVILAIGFGTQGFAHKRKEAEQNKYPTPLHTLFALFREQLTYGLLFLLEDARSRFGIK